MAYNSLAFNTLTKLLQTLVSSSLPLPTVSFYINREFSVLQIISPHRFSSRSADPVMINVSILASLIFTMGATV